MVTPGTESERVNGQKERERERERAWFFRLELATA